MPSVNFGEPLMIVSTNMDSLKRCKNFIIYNSKTNKKKLRPADDEKKSKKTHELDNFEIRDCIFDQRDCFLMEDIIDTRIEETE